jgi:Mn-dependent DtxR family transcriptional regulator
MKMRTTLTFHETIKVNDIHREMKVSNPSVSFSEAKLVFFKERHLKDIEKAKKTSRKVRAVEKNLKRRKHLLEKFEIPQKMD